MRSDIGKIKTQYELKQAGKWQGMAAKPTEDWHVSNSMEEFFVEHYWGYNQQPNGSTMEYEVTHPKWHTRPGELTRFDLDVKTLYGQDWAGVLGGAPDSIVLAEGSAVNVFSGARI